MSLPRAKRDAQLEALRADVHALRWALIQGQPACELADEIEDVVARAASLDDPKVRRAADALAGLDLTQGGTT